MTEIETPRRPGRPAREGHYRAVAGKVPAQLAALVLAPVGRKGKPYRIKNDRVTDLLQAGVESESQLSGTETHIRAVYTGDPTWVYAEIPAALAQLVLAPVNAGTSPSITSRLIDLLHLGLQDDQHTIAERSRSEPLDQTVLEYAS